MKKLAFANPGKKNRGTQRLPPRQRFIGLNHVFSLAVTPLIVNQKLHLTTSAVYGQRQNSHKCILLISRSAECIFVMKTKNNYSVNQSGFPLHSAHLSPGEIGYYFFPHFPVAFIIIGTNLSADLILLRHGRYCGLKESRI